MIEIYHVLPRVREWRNVAIACPRQRPTIVQFKILQVLQNCGTKCSRAGPITGGYEYCEHDCYFRPECGVSAPAGGREQYSQLAVRWAVDRRGECREFSGRLHTVACHSKRSRRWWDQRSYDRCFARDRFNF